MFWLGKDSMLCRGNRSMAASLLPTSLLLLMALLKGFFLLNGALGKEIPFPLSPFPIPFFVGGRFPKPNYYKSLIQ